METAQERLERSIAAMKSDAAAALARAKNARTQKDYIRDRDMYLDLLDTLRTYGIFAV